MPRRLAAYELREGLLLLFHVDELVSVACKLLWLMAWFARCLTNVRLAYKGCFSLPWEASDCDSDMLRNSFWYDFAFTLREELWFDKCRSQTRVRKGY